MADNTTPFDIPEDAETIESLDEETRYRSALVMENLVRRWGLRAGRAIGDDMRDAELDQVLALIALDDEIAAIMFGAFIEGLDAFPSPDVGGGGPAARTRRCSCGGDLVLRQGPKGAFYGCSNYPRCRKTKPGPGEVSRVSAHGLVDALRRGGPPE